MKKILSTFIMGCLALSCMIAQNPKREFRGAWLHTVGQKQYAQKTTEENKRYLREQLDLLKAAGVNAIIFQVRPQADALYPSKLEPWSRHLTGKAGVAPSPKWDPLQFMIEESHARGMELHAWLNPYRVTTSSKEVLPKNHIYYKHPERFVSYDGKMYFDPGLPENIKFIEDVVKDIVTRYDVDAIHMDDYFYPYPKEGEDFPDKASYEKYGNKMDVGDWRRQNVNVLIEGLHDVIIANKPWVRLGISPFGIWRNKTSDPKGSDTNGLQNYDQLYADVLLWTEKGWVDYMLPQLYWELEHPKASSEKLAYWWNENGNGRHMYFGQDVNRTMTKLDIEPSTDKNQLAHKIRLSRELPNVQGNCWWPGYSVAKNFKNIADSLTMNQQSTIALVPAYTWIDNIAPSEVANLKGTQANNNVMLQWDAPKTKDKLQQARAFVVYRFVKGEEIDLGNPASIQTVTYGNSFIDANVDKGNYVYVVTVLDRANNESPNGVSVEVNN